MAMTGGFAELLKTGIPDYGAATNYPVKLYAYHKSKQDEQACESTVSLGMYLVVPSGYPVGPWTDFNGSYIGSKDNEFDGSIAKITGKKWLTENQTLTVKHDDSTGEATVEIPWQWGVNSPWGQFVIPSGSFKVKLPTIPRASTIGATGAYIGEGTTITVNRKTAGRTHSIAFQFGTQKGYITPDGGISDTEVIMDSLSISWIVPTAFYSEIPNAKQGTCTLTITTYSGTTQIGEPQTGTFTVRADQEACAPLVSGTVTDANETTLALTGDPAALVRYRSTALCTISAEARNSAKISKRQINGKTVSGNTLSIPEVEISSVSFAASDSRGYSGAAQVDFELIPYVPLTNNAEATRVNIATRTSVLTLQGNYFNGSFGAADNALQLWYSVDGGDFVDVEAEISGNGYSATVEIADLDYTASHTVEVVASDLLDTVSKTVTIGMSIPMVYRNAQLYGFTTNIVAPKFLQCGIVKVTPSAADTPTEGEVVFGTPFDAPPIVALGVVSRVPGTVLKGVSFAEVTTAGFKVWLTRSDVVETWIHWIAVYQPTNPLERSINALSENNTEEGGET